MNGEGNGNPLQYSCLENPMGRGVWLATVHGVARVRHDLLTKRPPPHTVKCCKAEERIIGELQNLGGAGGEGGGRGDRDGEHM